MRSWLEENHPGPTPEGDDAGFEFRRAWQRKLNERGWAGLSWPRVVNARIRGGASGPNTPIECSNW